MHLLAQTSVISNSKPAVDLEVAAVLIIVFGSLLILGVTFLVTRTIVAIKVASIHAQLTEKLVREGVPSEQIVSIIRSNQSRLSLPSFRFRKGWKKAEADFSKSQRKPQPL